LVSPRLIELCFQTAGIWEMGVQERMGLPQYIQRLLWYRMPDPADDPLYAIVTPDLKNGTFDADVVNAAGNCLFRISGYRTVAFPSAIDEEPLKALKAVMSLQEAAA